MLVKILVKGLVKRVEKMWWESLGVVWGMVVGKFGIWLYVIIGVGVLLVGMGVVFMFMGKVDENKVFNVLSNDNG